MTHYSKVIICSLTLAGCFTFFSLQAQNIPNGGFEDWRTDLGIEAPSGDEWGTSDQVWAILGVEVEGVTKTDERNSGNFAAKIRADTAEGGSLPGFLIANYPYWYRPLSFKGYYKETLRSADAAVMQVLFSRYNSTTKTSDSIGGCFWVLPRKGDLTFQEFEVPIGFVDSDPNNRPDSVTINIFVSSNDTTRPSGYVLVDDLKFDGANVGIAADNFLSSTSLYPNPANANINLELELAKPALLSIDVLDMQGVDVIRLQRAATSSGNQKFNISTDEIPSGNYICRIVSGNSVQVKKLTVIH